MIYLVILLSISLLLIYGSWRDWHHAQVSNKITFAAIALSVLALPLVGDYFFRAFFILVYYFMWKKFIIGGADFKILIAVILSVPNLFLFLSTFIVYSLIITIQMRITEQNKRFARIAGGIPEWFKERIPGFVPITMSYIVTFLLTMTAAIFA